MTQRVKITWKKSGIGCGIDQKNTIRALGLRKLYSFVVHADTPVIRGMIRKVEHLVDVEEV